MARKTITDMAAWPSLTLEGNLIAPAMVAQVYSYGASEQSAEDYGIRKGLTVREEISTAFRVGQSHFDAFTKIASPSAEATQRFCKAFLEQTFGFDDLAPGDGVAACVAGGRVPVVVVPPSEERLDRRSPTLSVDRTRSPAFALQDYLNDHDDALWGIVTNGAQIRLMRDNASLTRPAYIEADLAQIFQNEDAASFAVLWLLIHRTRFGVEGTPATDCALERWRDAGSREGAVARDKLAGQVEQALKLLGSGFLEANPDLAQSLKSGEVNLTEWFNELLRLVYRLIFLMVAEDRNLLHPEKSAAEARKLYAEGYSLTHLRAQCFRAATWDKHHDRYEAVKIVFQALTQGQPVLALPPLSGLFAQDRLPHLETARLRNRAFMEALYRLSWLAEGNGMVPVNWRAMETEELGSVYESLLELQPQLADDGKTLIFASEATEQKGNQRKTTGSYYTPDSLVQALLDTALNPVLDKTEAESDDPTEALLKLSVIDPACGSGHFLLAAARRIATRLARIRAEGTPSLADFRHALRDVARCCIYGTDLNPMAVELTKVALWIETVDPGLPLGFFDAQIRCGNALLGVFDLKVLKEGIPDAAYKPLTGDDKDTAKYYLQANRAARVGQGGFDFGEGTAAMPAMKPLAVDFSGFRDLPEDTVEQISTKSKRFRELRKSQAFLRAKAAADLYVAAFLLPKTGGALVGASARTVPTTEELWMALNQGKIRNAMVNAPKAARSARALHWPLEFPDVMQRGGFDVVLGNPPWERIKLQEQEFFAVRSFAIASAPNKATRDRLIKELQFSSEGSPEKLLYKDFAKAKRDAEATSEFVRIDASEGGRFPLSGQGDTNTYALFAELFMSLSGNNGRCGLIVPSGLVLDNTTKDLFRSLLKSKRLESFFEFENNGFFGAGHGHMLRFALTTIAPENSVADPTFLFQAVELPELSVEERSFKLTLDDIDTLNPNTGTAAIFRSKYDAELNKHVYSDNQILQHGDSPDEEEWPVKLATMFHTSNDSYLFRSFKQLSEQGARADDNRFILEDSLWLPFYEAKMFSQFNHRHGDYSKVAPGARPHQLPKFTVDELADPNREVIPHYWVSKKDVDRRLSDWNWTREWILAWRDVADARASARSAIFAALPTVAIGDTALLMMVEGDARNGAFLLGLFNSIVFDYFARQKIGGLKFRFFTLRQIVVPCFKRIRQHQLDFASKRVLELTYTSQSLRGFASDLGYDGTPFIWDEDRRAQLRGDLDAFYARTYGLTRDELRYILDPADVKGSDYPSETFRILKEREINQYGEYRTRHLVLAAWDRMEANGEFTAMGM